MSAIRTQWSVLTGSPCSGKTTTLRSLEKRGFPVREEKAREYFEAELAKGRTLQEICSDQLALQNMFLETGLERDSKLDPKKPYILDRCPVDAVAHYMLYDFDYAEAMERAASQHYACVFYLAALPYKQDAVRVEDADLARKLDLCFQRAYEEMGYTLVHVPVMGVEERTQFIQDHLASLGVFPIA